MPSYYPCVMIVSGDITRWASKLNSSNPDGDIVDFSLHHHVPTDTEPLRKPGLLDNGYSHLWGTKWDATDVNVKYVNLESGKARVDFSCAWGVPHLYFLLSSKLYPECQFKVVFEGNHNNAPAGVITLYNDMSYDNKWIIASDRGKEEDYCSCYSEMLEDGGEETFKDGEECECCNGTRIGDDLTMFHLDWELGSVY